MIERSRKPIFGVLDLSPTTPKETPSVLGEQTRKQKTETGRITVDDYLGGKLRPQTPDAPRDDTSRIGNIEAEYTDKLLTKVDADIPPDPSLPLLFTGISGVEPKVIRKYGADSPNRTETYAFTREELQEPEPENNLWDRAEYGKKDAMVIVYDGTKLVEDPAATPFLYEFTEGVTPRDAIVAGYKIQWEKKGKQQ